MESRLARATVISSAAVGMERAEIIYLPAEWGARRSMVLAGGKRMVWT